MRVARALAEPVWSALDVLRNFGLINEGGSMMHINDLELPDCLERLNEAVQAPRSISKVFPMTLFPTPLYCLPSGVVQCHKVSNSAKRLVRRLDDAKTEHSG
jgi:hypothetical protein